MAKKREKIKEDGHEFDSNEEQYFWWWVRSLKEAGYIKDVVFQPESFKLADSLWGSYYKEMKRVPDKLVQEEIMPGKLYTCDAMIMWEEKAKDIFFTDIKSTLRKKERNSMKYLLAHKIDSDSFNGNDWYSYIEVKPVFDQNNMTMLAKVNIKWVYEKYQQYINMVIPEKLFNKTFTPKRFLYCNKDTNRKRKLKHKNVISLKSFIDNSSLDS